MDWINNPVRNGDYRSMEAAIRQAPPGTQKIYVLSAGSLQRANPKYVRLALGVSAEIMRLGEFAWNCNEESDLATFDHKISDGVVSLTVTLPRCAQFRFERVRFDEISNGFLYRSDEISYELPEATAWEQSGFLGRKMTVHVRPDARARFVIEQGRFRGIAWFDTPGP